MSRQHLVEEIMDSVIQKSKMNAMLLQLQLLKPGKIPRKLIDSRTQQEKYLAAVQASFLTHVNPVESLMDHLRQEDLMSEEEEDIVRAETTRKDQARKLWGLLHKIPDDKFWNKFVPVLHKLYPVITTESGYLPESSGTPPPTSVCVRHTMEKKISLRKIADILVQTNCIDAETYSELAWDPAPLVSRWKKVFTLLRQYTKGNKMLKTKIYEILQDHMSSADIKREIKASDFSCKCHGTPSFRTPLARTPSFQQPLARTPSFQQPLARTPSFRQPLARIRTIQIPSSSHRSIASFPTEYPDTVSSAGDRDADSASLASIVHEMSVDQETQPPFSSEEQRDLYIQIRNKIDTAIELFASIRPHYRRLEMNHHKCLVLRPLLVNGHSADTDSSRLADCVDTVNKTYSALLENADKANIMLQGVIIDNYRMTFPEYWFRMLLNRKHMLDLEQKEAAGFLDKAKQLICQDSLLRKPLKPVQAFNNKTEICTHINLVSFHGTLLNDPVYSSKPAVLP